MAELKLNSVIRPAENWTRPL